MALATAPVASALGVVRLSGPRAIAAAANLVRGLDTFPSRQVRRATLVHPDTGDVIDEAMCVVTRAPRSYTGEDVVELSCHGSPALLRLVLEVLVARGGVRLAEPGEFTRRAFMNGKLDLGQAEAVAMLIEARTERAVTLAARALSGVLSDRVHGLQDRLLDLVASLEVALDFPDDAVGIEAAAASKAADGLADEVDRLLASARRGRIVHEGVTVAIVGPPNAGKSSLFNALLGRARAIVAPQPGTTRDVIEGTISIAGVPVRLLDTAGLGAARDDVDAEGMRRARMAIEESDLVLVVQDGSRSYEAGLVEEAQARPRVPVRGKCDLPTHVSWSRHEGVAVSARTGEGIEQLLVVLKDALVPHGDEGEENGTAASLRQVLLLEATGRALRDGARALGVVPVEAALVELRDALFSLGELRGVAVADSVLDRVFATFCLGK